ncbi:tyrosine-type recombinase/integrase [Merismopedia glauca]|uniref:Integrase n=1 Tax=Merismopedia glauca CCAP 1448/3 TaxID=1296344 RepID=A0A2T1BX23_9CYAN|nr:tyrosine-type recombinase/integrase [Merismopedia glauca]PSB00474.1 integrase [Merismopedia glauca CCAP 1448/3]
MTVLVTQSPSTDIVAIDRLSALFDRYLQTDVGEGDASADTVKTYRTNLKQFLSWCQALNLHPLSATRSQIKEFRLWLIEAQKYQRATIALKLSVVRRFYDALIERELTNFNPALGLKPPREAIDPAAKINYLESEEMRSLIENLPQDNSVASLRDRLLVAMMVIQGVRTIEMHRVSVGDIVKRGADVGLKVKGKRSLRIVPLTPDLADLLRQYLTARKQAGENLTEDTPLFVSYSRNCDSSRLSRRSMQRIVDKYLIANGLKPEPVKRQTRKTAAIPKSEVVVPTKQGGTLGDRDRRPEIDTITIPDTARANAFSLNPEPSQRVEPDSTVVTQEPSVAVKGQKLSKSRSSSLKRSLSAHSLRHTAGTLALRAGASLRQVQDLLGHADPRTTALYAHIADRWLANPALWLDVPAL